MMLSRFTQQLEIQAAKHKFKRILKEIEKQYSLDIVLDLKTQLETAIGYLEDGQASLQIAKQAQHETIKREQIFAKVRRALHLMLVISKYDEQNTQKIFAICLQEIRTRTSNFLTEFFNNQLDLELFAAIEQIADEEYDKIITLMDAIPTDEVNKINALLALPLKQVLAENISDFDANDLEPLAWLEQYDTSKVKNDESLDLHIQESKQILANSREILNHIEVLIPKSQALASEAKLARSVIEGNINAASLNRLAHSLQNMINGLKNDLPKLMSDIERLQTAIDASNDNLQQLISGIEKPVSWYASDEEDNTHAQQGLDESNLGMRRRAVLS